MKQTKMKNENKMKEPSQMDGRKAPGRLLGVPEDPQRVSEALLRVSWVPLGAPGRQKVRKHCIYAVNVIAPAGRSAGQPGQTGRMRVPKVMKTLVFFEVLIREIAVARVLGGGPKPTGSKVLRILTF